jgi:phosphogluconate dehydratase
MLTESAARRAAVISAQGPQYTPLYEVVTEKSIVNAMVGLLATGGSTNHTIHLVAIARAAGILIDWSDFSDLSAAVPLLARVYPNGPADVNQFHAAGGMSYLIHELRAGGLLNEDVKTVSGKGMAGQSAHPQIDAGEIVWLPSPRESGNKTILRAVTEPFSADGGLRLLTGNLGRSVIKVSAVAPEHQIVEAPAIVFDDQEDVLAAFKRGELERNFVAVLRFQGPRANGMPELHKLTPALGVLQDRGFNVALVTDGRMSGASGKVPAAIHVTPEVVCGGSLGKVLTGDMIRLDAQAGTLDVLVTQSELESRVMPVLDAERNSHGMGRELFAGFRGQAGSAEEGALSLGLSH